MSEQSSAVVMFRALVMLVCLIAIPVAALFGSSIPGVVKAIQAGRWPTLAELKGTPAPQTAIPSEAAAFVPSGGQSPLNSTVPMMIPGAPNAQPVPFPPAARANPWTCTGSNCTAGPVVPAGYEAAVGPLPPVVGNPLDAYSYVQDRLRQLGVTYYLLESWGDQKREFRFYCRMPMGGNSQHWRPFWSIDTDPLRAMNQVLQQVETWQAANRS